MSIKIMAFDIDNTLVFGPEAEAFYALYKQALNKAFAEATQISNEQASVCLDAFRAAHRGRGELAFDTFNLPAELVYNAICGVDPVGRLSCMTSTVQLLETVRHRVRLIAVTDGPREQAERILRVTSIPAEWFTEIIAWERGQPKPKNGESRVFTDILNRYRLLPEELLMIGDTLDVDILPADRLGIRTVHVGSGAEPPQEIDSMRLLELL